MKPLPIKPLPMKSLSVKPLLAIAALALLFTGAEAGSQKRAVTIGGDADLDACATYGKVARLGPRRAEDPKSGFLSVRSGPGGAAYFELDQLHNGNEVIVCETVGPWLGVIYPDRGQAFEICSDEAGASVARRTPYAGACRSGWIHERYVEITAG